MYKHVMRQKLLHTETLLHTQTFTHSRYYTQTLLHTDAFRTSVFGDPTSFRVKGTCDRVARDKLKSQFHLSFYRSNLTSSERVAPDDLKSQFYLSFWRSNLISCQRVARDKLKSQFYLSFWRSNLISCERVAFRAVSLPLPLLPPSRRGQEGKRRRCEMRRCKDEKM